MVFSSLNHALADTIDPGLTGHQLGSGTLKADLDSITAAVENPYHWLPDPDSLESLIRNSSEEALLQRWQLALASINQHWDRLLADEPSLLSIPRWKLRLMRQLRSIGSIAGRLGLK